MPAAFGILYNHAPIFLSILKFQTEYGLNQGRVTKTSLKKPICKTFKMLMLNERRNRFNPEFPLQKKKLITNKYDVKAIHKQFVPHTSVLLEKWLQTHFAVTQRHKSPPLISQRD